MEDTVMIWHYAEGNEQKGPIDDQEFRRLVDIGTIRASTLVWREDMENWAPWSQVADREMPVPADEDSGVCVECGQVFPAEQLVAYGPSRVCANCKSVFFQKAREGLTSEGTLQYAGFWIRAASWIIDFVILFFVGLLIGMLDNSAAQATPDNPFAAFTPLSVFLMLLNVAIACAYETGFVGRFGATPGKMACGLRIVFPDGGRIGYGRAFGRHFAEWLSAYTIGIGYIMAAFDSEKRTLHDRICNTRVIRK